MYNHRYITYYIPLYRQVPNLCTCVCESTNAVKYNQRQQHQQQQQSQHRERQQLVWLCGRPEVTGVVRKGEHFLSSYQPDRRGGYEPVGRATCPPGWKRECSGFQVHISILHYYIFMLYRYSQMWLSKYFTKPKLVEVPIARRTYLPNPCIILQVCLHSIRKTEIKKLQIFSFLFKYYTSKWRFYIIIVL